MAERQRKTPVEAVRGEYELVLAKKPDRAFPSSPPSRADVELSQEHKLLGNQAFSARAYEDALVGFSRAILFNPYDHLLYSNRSACWANLGRYIEALDDAMICTTLAPEFAKGWGRKGLAEYHLGRWSDEKKSYETGLAADPSSQSLHQALETASQRSQRPYHMMLFAPRFLNLERLFERLEDPTQLTEEYVSANEALLNLQLEYLTQTLHMDWCAPISSWVAPAMRHATEGGMCDCAAILIN
ncbi:hypothetical protein CYMTET_32215 [Cymbomonas tetramitiformis]|uniref:TPR-like protein n=1 Tax=Cymbomonas tetramitiformis TaxID=36881 RepID=A0AAE0KS62_9CHLO|nr:hypothetical protein CYMTET_32215 [Cymbomonas tetramitiformis]